MPFLRLGIHADHSSLSLFPPLHPLTCLPPPSLTRSSHSLLTPRLSRKTLCASLAVSRQSLQASPRISRSSHPYVCVCVSERVSCGNTSFASESPRRPALAAEATDSPPGYDRRPCRCCSTHPASLPCLRLLQRTCMYAMHALRLQLIRRESSCSTVCLQRAFHLPLTCDRLPRSCSANMRSLRL